MVRLFRSISFLVIVLVASGGASRAQIANIQVTPNGAATGSCGGGGVPILTPSQFNSSSNWGNSAGKIGSGTNILLCGTFSGNSGASGLQFQGGGVNGNPITLTCDKGTNFTAPYWSFAPGGAIVDNGHSYITMNGSGCTIQNSANGTGLGNLAASTAFYVNGASNVIIENFTIANFCLLGSGPTDCRTSGNWDVSIYLQNVSNTTVQGNTIHDTNTAIEDNCSSSNSGNTFTKNTIYNINWGVISAGSGGGGGNICSNETVSFNDISGMGLWDNTSPTDHHDAIFFYTDPGSGNFSNGSIYGNYIHGDNGGGATAFIFVQENGGSIANLNIFNNVLINSRTGGWYGNGLIGTSGGHVFNNTIDCNNNGDGAIQVIQDNGSAMIENNVISNCPMGVYLHNGITLAASNNNVLYNLTGSDGDGVMVLGGTPCPTQIYCPTVAAWKAATGLDGASTTSDPKLSGSYMLQSGSSAIGMGANLTNQGVSALDISAPQTFGANYACGSGCIPRPTSGAWDSGAYEFAAGTVVQVNPPTGLTAVVQ